MSSLAHAEEASAQICLQLAERTQVLHQIFVRIVINVLRALVLVNATAAIIPAQLVDDLCERVFLHLVVLGQLSHIVFLVCFSYGVFGLVELSFLFSDTSVVQEARH